MRFAAFAVTLLAIALPARGDGFEFARELVQKKLYDLAEEEFRRILSDGSRSDEERAEGELGLALVAKARAIDARLSGAEPLKVLELFAAAERGLEEFLAGHPGHPRRARAAFELGYARFLKGEYLAGRGEEGAAGAHRGAIEMLARAERDLPEGWDRARARFHRVVVPYYLGRALPAGSAERRDALDEAARGIDAFVWDHEDDILGGYAYLYLALVKREREEHGDALELFRTVLSYPLPDRAEDPREYRIWSELLLQTGKALGEFGVDRGGDPLEVALVELPALRGRVPDVLDRKFGQLMLIELARGQFARGRRMKAMELLAEVGRRADGLSASESWARSTARRATALLDELFHGDTRLMTGGMHFRVAEGRMSTGRYPEALRAYQTTIVAEPAGSELAARAWERSARCYYLTERFVEAFVVYGLVERSFPDLAGDAGYWRYRSAVARHAETRDSRDAKMMRDARRRFADRYPRHRKAAGLLYDEGEELIAAGRHARAVEAFGRVGVTSVRYEKALARIGEALFKLGRLREALIACDRVFRYVEDPENATTDERRLRNRRHARAVAAYYSARSHADLGSALEALDALGDFEQLYPDKELAVLHPHVKLERLRAFLALSRLEDGVREGRSLLSHHRGSALTAEAFRLLALALQATSRHGEAADHLALHVELKERPTAGDHETLGVWLYRLRRWAEAVRQLERARALGARERVTRMLAEAHIALGEFGPARDLLEEILVPDPGARDRVRKLLLLPAHTPASLEELMRRIRAESRVMESLARTYRGVGDREDLLRGMSLMDILLRARERRYTEDWWRWRLLRAELLLDYGTAHGSTEALRRVIADHDLLKRLGVLEGSGLEGRFREVRKEAVRRLR